MPRRKKDDPIGVGLTAKQMRRKKPINADLLVDIEPLTKNQEKFFEEYDANKHLFAYGCAGTGKTFIALYKALKQVLSDDNPYEKIYIVRSLAAISAELRPHERLDSFLEIMRISPLCIRFHTRTWLSTCSRCLLMQTLKCCMVI